MTAGRGPRHAGRKGGAPVRKSITTRYFYSTAVLLICSIAVMGFIQMYLAMGYFREENGTDVYKRQVRRRMAAQFLYFAGRCVDRCGEPEFWNNDVASAELRNRRIESIGS